MVEVVHDVAHAVALLANKVLDRDPDVIKLDESGSRGVLARNLEQAARDALLVFQGHD
jgi:hypothetical protein